MIVEFVQAERAPVEDQVVEEEVLVEPVGAVGELGVVVVPLDEFVDEVEGRHAGQ